MRLTVLIVSLLGLVASTVSAADLRLLTAGAFKPVALEIVPVFEKVSGHKVRIDNDTAGVTVTDASPSR